MVGYEDLAWDWSWEGIGTLFLERVPAGGESPTSRVLGVHRARPSVGRLLAVLRYAGREVGMYE